jgi:MFS family permease
MAATHPRTRVGAALTHAPLSGSYASAVALALLALCPFIVLTTASALFQDNLVSDLGTGRFGTELAEGLSNAAYAFGAVASADLVLRLPTRRVYIVAEGVFVLGSLLGVFSPEIVAFTVARVLQGLGTGMLLVAALPPLITGHGARKLPSTAAWVNLGLFGMVTLGPVVGGLVGGFGGWRLLFASVAFLGACGMALAVLAFEPNEPPARGVGFDWLAMPLAAGATFLPFFAVSWLFNGSFASAGFIVPMVLGVGILLALIVAQYRKRGALMPMKLISHTLPVVGVIGAMGVGAAFTTMLELLEVYLLMVVAHGPAVVGGLLASQLLGIGLAAWLFKKTLSTKWMPYLALSGLVTLVVAGAILLALSPGANMPIAVIAALLLGYGAGAGVAPGLFMAGLSVPSSQIGPTFALVELLRSEAAFIVGPILLTVAMTTGSLAAGLHLSFAIILAFIALVGVLVLAIYALGGARPHAPNLEGWLRGDSSAYGSPHFAARIRSGVPTGAESPP